MFFKCKHDSLCTIPTFMGANGPLRAKGLSANIGINSGVWAVFGIRFVISGFIFSENSLVCGLGQMASSLQNQILV